MSKIDSDLVFLKIIKEVAFANEVKRAQITPNVRCSEDLELIFCWVEMYLKIIGGYKMQIILLFLILKKFTQ